MADLVLFPNCDIHVALHGTPPFRLRVASRDLVHPANMQYKLDDVTSTCTFDLFAPYNPPGPVGNRLEQFVNIDATGLVTPIKVGINLLQVRLGNAYIVARIQVHDTIQDWWYGNASITTAKDAAFAHAQPSIYALFSDDPSKTDLVGDITGHGYVPLTPSDPTFFTVNADGRLQGLKEGVDQTLSGTFLGKTKTLKVKIVDYGKARTTLQYVQIPDVNHLDTMHNMLFLGEGFREGQADRDLFDKIVTKVVDELLTKPRHAPYNLLQGSFNVWKAYEPSTQHCVTCGYRVNDVEVGSLVKGNFIPYPNSVSKDKNVYAVDELVRLVGLPLRGESRSTADLKTLWASQSLQRLDPSTNSWVNNFDPGRVDDDVVAAWKAQTSVGILEARDTFFGLYLGARPGDRLSSASNPVLPPAHDNPGDANLAPFVHRMYEWFDTGAARVMVPDPRRHPPELQAGNVENLGNSMWAYIKNLKSPFAPDPNVGEQWVPDPAGAVFKRSRGLIALITNDAMDGGANINRLTITTTTLNSRTIVAFEYAGSGTEKIMRRTPPDSTDESTDEIINTVAHEFGHSFHLDDEYEEFVGDQPNGPGGVYDNRCVLSEVNLDAGFLVDRNIDPDKVKWFDLPRIELSDTLVRDSEDDGGSLLVMLDKRFIPRWVEAKAQNKKAYLRKLEPAPDGQQLPFPVGDSHYLVNLDIEKVNVADGTILLGGGELPPSPIPVFPAGSLLFLPKRDASDNLVFIVEKKVIDALKSTHLPLNKDTDTQHLNRDADDPVDIPNFKPPCKSYKLVGLYEGAGRWTGMMYRPAGQCKMRDEADGEFCHLCKYLIVNRVDPGNHALMDKKYYPTAKKNG